MAVKVVSDKPIKTYKVMCSKCFYELEYTPIDVSSRVYKDYDGGSDTHYWIVCPREECKNQVTVKSAS